MSKKFKIEGMKELEESLKKLNKIPQKCVNRAAKQGAQIVLESAKANAPEDIGNLKAGLKLVREKTRVRGKKVLQVTFNRDFNHIFVKVSKTGNRSYYPASQEYGFKTRSGGYIPGFRYLKKSITQNQQQIEKKIVDVLSKEIDKLK
jgi:HK97 gp10 family phage protein